MARLPFRVALLVLLLFVAGLAGCGDDSSSDETESVSPSTEAEVPPEGDASEVPPEEDGADPTGPNFTIDLATEDDRHPGEWSVSMVPGDCTEEQVDAVLIRYSGCVTLEAAELSDEFDGISGGFGEQDLSRQKPPDHGYFQLYAEPAHRASEAGFVLIFTVVPRPAGYSNDDDSDFMACGPEWCRVSQTWQDTIDGDPLTDIRTSGVLASNGTFSPEDVLFLMMGPTESVGLIGAIGGDGRDATAEAEPLADCLIEEGLYNFLTNAGRCLDD